MRNHEVVIYEQIHGRTLLTVYEVSRVAGLHPELVRRLFVMGLIDPHVAQTEPLFEDSVVGRIRKIMRLRNDLGVNLSGCGVVLELLERINQLEQRLRHYEQMKAG